ncbi:MAG: hypothetical protein KF693_00355 [Nitrospira sp.]|nr:hypothetical protein [Nitrospira sp.]
MCIRLDRLCALLLLLGAVIMVPRIVHAEEQQSSHRTFSGVVVKQGTGLVVKTPDGATYQVNEKQSHQHGHAAFKEGDRVSVVVDENNTAIDVHHKGEEGKHTFVTGKLLHLGKMDKRVKLQTAEGEKVFPLTRQEIKTKGIDPGTEVTVELNEAGAVIDLHRVK